jgi:hypothetical protein
MGYQGKASIGRAVQRLALFNLAIDSKFRGCDVVKVGVEDVLLSGSRRS